MAHFRRRPIPVEAVQLRWDTWSAVCSLTDAPQPRTEGCYVDQDGKETDDTNGRIGLKSRGPDGAVIAVQDDWIVRMPDGELIAFKPAAFEALFESHSEYKVEYEPDWKKYPKLAAAFESPTKRDELRRLLVDARTDAVQYVHDVRAEELVRARADERERLLQRIEKKFRSLGFSFHVERANEDPTSASVRELTNEQLLQALHNVGCHLDTCDACAEIFFTGSKTHEHTCPKER